MRPEPTRRAPSTSRLIRFALGVVGASALIVVFAGPRALRLPLAARAPVWVHRAFAFALGIRVEARGRLAQGGVLVAANHVSWLDIVALGALAPMTFVAKSELGATRAARALLGLQGVVFVERGRRTAIPAANAAMADALRRGETVVLFAEATTGDGNRILPFRSAHLQAALAAAAPVQPARISYPRRAGLPVTRAERPMVAWYGLMAFTPHLWAVLRGGRLTCRVGFAEPIAGTSRKALARAAQQAVQACAEAGSRT